MPPTFSHTTPSSCFFCARDSGLKYTKPSLPSLLPPPGDVHLRSLLAPSHPLGFIRNTLFWALRWTLSSFHPAYFLLCANSVSKHLVVLNAYMCLYIPDYESMKAGNYFSFLLLNPEHREAASFVQVWKGTLQAPHAQSPAPAQSWIASMLACHWRWDPGQNTASLLGRTFGALWLKKKSLPPCVKTEFLWQEWKKHLPLLLTPTGFQWSSEPDPVSPCIFLGVGIQTLIIENKTTKTKTNKQKQK
jgi:hypothetical protein